MKSKIIGILALAFIVFSCAPKKAITHQEVVNPPKVVAVLQPGMHDAKKETKERLSGKNLYETNCAKCHALRLPAEHSKEKWGPILQKMQRKAKLSDDEITAVKEYIFSQTKE
jgi:cytochrome c5